MEEKFLLLQFYASFYIVMSILIPLFYVKNMHPLIKAAVAQSYLLVLRPFPEGNERLSRMMSSAVLLRCG